LTNKCHSTGCASVQVAAVNPSFHRTPILGAFANAVTANWNKLPKEIKDEYGVEKYDLVRYTTEVFTTGSWDSRHVVDAMAHAVTGSYPRHQYLVGMDAKFSLPFLGLMPPRIRDDLMMMILSKSPPKSKKDSEKTRRMMLPCYHQP